MNTWADFIQQQQQQDYYNAITKYVDAERSCGKNIYPPAADVLNAFKATELNQVKVVILGQDPYHGAGQAHGLAFSVLPNIKIPPSLVNIYKELADDIDGFSIPNHGYLQSWADQGVMLLNTVLTVEEGKAHSHAKCGWEQFTSAAIERLNQQQGIVFLLWGAHAQKKGKKIDRSKHLVLETVHPSPLSVYRGFWGCKHFSQTNQYLQQQGKTAINWQI